jgi:DNA-binding winged helix-turn-helix (wHTH) protein/tetratricopeptide (TPR) repeat protein
MKARFADVELDADAMVLRRAGQPVHAEPQVLEVLTYLVEHHDRLVPKTELLDEIWGDRFVSESALSSRIKSARQAIGDNGRDQRLIKTVHGRGFRFVGELHDLALPPTSGSSASAVGVLDRLTGGTGAAVVLTAPSSAARAKAADALVHLALDRGLLVGHGRAGGLRTLSGVREALDEWRRRRPDLTAGLPPGCDAVLDQLGGGEEASRPHLLLAARELLDAAGSSDRGALLLVEDAHLADAQTVELLVHLARAAGRVRAVVAITAPGAEAFSPWFHAVPDEHGTDVQAPPGGDPREAPPALPADVRHALALVAATSPTVRRGELAAAAELTTIEADRVIEIAEAADVLVAHPDGHRFLDPEEADRLERSLDPGARAGANRAVAVHLQEVGAPDAAVARRLVAAGELQDAAPLLVGAAFVAAMARQHAEVLDLTARVDEVLDPATKRDLLELRADALAARGDHEAIPRYREAIRLADPDQLPWLRARLARVHLYAGEVDAAAEVLEGVPTEGPAAGGIALMRGAISYFQGGIDEAEVLIDSARALALAPGAPPMMLDVITMQGMIAHSRGQWFDRLRQELRATASSPDLAQTIFDSHVCVAQYLLYGPSGADEVLRLASELAVGAEAAGATRALGFAATLRGEAHLLRGDLAAAREALEASVVLHREVQADTGLAHALQRLAEVALAEGNRAEAEARCREALPLARWSPIARHLLQRSYGTLIASAPDPAAAVRIADEALAVDDGPLSCEFCGIMLSVPAAIAYAQAGLLPAAHEQLAAAERCATRWEGPAWPAAVDEVRAVLARAEGDEEEADARFRAAAEGFDRAGQPLDAARCREAR